jgi:8-oxo-dGTP pyrophosphatase MutT (NUDIX family)
MSKFLELVEKDGWEYVKRTTGSDVIVIIPYDINENKLFFVRQNRIPVGGPVIEFPAGLVDPGETPIDAAYRELKEDVGFTTRQLYDLGSFPASAGLTDEVVHYFGSLELQRISDKLGVKEGPTELLQSDPFNANLALINWSDEGAKISNKVLAGLFLLMNLMAQATNSSLQFMPQKVVGV